MKRAMLTGLAALATLGGAQCLETTGTTGYLQGDRFSLAEVTLRACGGIEEMRVEMRGDENYTAVYTDTNNSNGFRPSDDRFLIATADGWVEYADGTARTSDGGTWDVSPRAMAAAYEWMIGVRADVWPMFSSEARRPFNPREPRPYVPTHVPEPVDHVPTTPR